MPVPGSHVQRGVPLLAAQGGVRTFAQQVGRYVYIAAAKTGQAVRSGAERTASVQAQVAQQVGHVMSRQAVCAHGTPHHQYVSMLATGCLPALAGSICSRCRWRHWAAHLLAHPL